MKVQSNLALPANYQPIPSGLCCMNFMSVKTGVYIVVYIDLMGLTAQLAYVAARMMIYCCTTWTFLIALSSAVQLVVCYLLFHGVKYNRPVFLALYLSVGIILRGFLAFFALAIVAFASFFDSVHESVLAQNGITRCVMLAAVLMILIGSGVVVYRCLVYIRDIQEFYKNSKKDFSLCPHTDYICRQNAGLLPNDHNDMVYRNSDKLARCQFHPIENIVGIDKHGHSAIYHLEDRPTDV
ncbi:unnamed protein product [Bursaphelenchus xylophilus]|uniref:(pine wood nematode) hypothetical protein n=1 Tax=Bursaphelenchus xylophilus TaxID=6326 RepID=A0A1I7SEG5_BURXY|nr:unnamed protein product [Bursaphelenchus xylophilus]CAG9103946.1 unnamed protein product [Bursaphelenchus xylophilus]